MHRVRPNRMAKQLPHTKKVNMGQRPKRPIMLKRGRGKFGNWLKRAVKTVGKTASKGFNFMKDKALTKTNLKIFGKILKDSKALSSLAAMDSRTAALSPFIKSIGFGKRRSTRMYKKRGNGLKPTGAGLNPTGAGLNPTGGRKRRAKKK